MIEPRRLIIDRCENGWLVGALTAPAETIPAMHHYVFESTTSAMKFVAAYLVGDGAAEVEAALHVHHQKE